MFSSVISSILFDNVNNHKIQQYPYILKRNFNPKTYAFTDVQLERFDDERLNRFKNKEGNSERILSRYIPNSPG